MSFVTRIFSAVIVFISFLLSILGSLFGIGGSNPPEVTEPSTTQESTAEISTTARAEATTQAAVESALKIRIGTAQVGFGINEQSVVAAMGQPTERLVESQKDGKSIVSLVYADDYSKLAIFQIFNNSLSGFYTVNKEAVISDKSSSYSLGNTASKDSVDITICEYKDSLNSDKVYAFHAFFNDFSYRTANLSDFKNQSVINFYVVNALRAINGIAPLEYCEKAEAAIKLHCEDMAKNNYFDHTALDGSSCLDRMIAQGVSLTACAENIAIGCINAYDFADAWYNSEGHRNSMLDAKYDHIGVGFAVSESGTAFSGQNYYKSV